MCLYIGFQVSSDIDSNNNPNFVNLYFNNLVHGSFTCVRTYSFIRRIKIP